VTRLPKMLRATVIGLGAFILLGFVFGHRLEAQQDTIVTPSTIGGSYRSSCPQTSYNETKRVISAKCYRPHNGGLNDTSIAYGTCDPTLDIWNSDGYLTCVSPVNSPGSGRAIPRGSYQRSCERMTVNQTGNPSAPTLTLSGYCSYNQNNGQTTGARPASIDLMTPGHHCDLSRDIWNDQAKLRCYVVTP